MEKRIQLQEEEICILKSALSNALTRIQALELGKREYTIVIVCVRLCQLAAPNCAYNLS